MPHTKESALRELNGNLNDEQIRIINEGYCKAYQSDYDEVERMASIYIDYGK